MNGQYPCMALKTKGAPKLQRGLSLTPELYAAIQREADKYGLTWNETAERVLRRAFLSPGDSQIQAETASNKAGGGKATVALRNIDDDHSA